MYYPRFRVFTVGASHSSPRKTVGDALFAERVDLTHHRGHIAGARQMKVKLQYVHPRLFDVLVAK
jgi:hypothetical protein